MNRSSKANQKNYTSAQRTQEISTFQTAHLSNSVKAGEKDKSHQNFIVDWQMGNVSINVKRQSKYFF